MNKLGIWAIAIAGAFLIGILSANPIVEAEWMESSSCSFTRANSTTNLLDNNRCAF